MSDRAAVQLHVYDCPDDQRAALFAAIEAADLGEDWGSLASATDRNAEPLAFWPTQYTAEEMSCGIVEELANELIAAAPGATFDVWQDPKYEWLGNGVTYAPDLGRFAYECGSAGAPIFTGEEVLHVYRRKPSTLARYVGEPWQERLAEHRKRLERKDAA